MAFNLKNQNNFPEENNIFEEQKKEINYLESRIQELIQLIKQRKEKIVSIFTRLLPDKEKELNLVHIVKNIALLSIYCYRKLVYLV